MSVRDGLLAVLTLGEGYGLQLHSELAARSPHRRAVNVGQIYSTLERLSRTGLVEPAGMSADSLPLYRLTDAGQHAAAAWMTEPLLDSLPEWTEMLDQVLVTSSIDPAAATAVAERYRRWWECDLAATRSTTEPMLADARLALVAREAQAVAAIVWLGSAIAAFSDYDTFRALSGARPKRGRRSNS
ncbi:PadR family transcriptional regulator [Frigoribacterium sp. CG_9.8]|uniref:PadR family transcriptional regulator n=1 Tax=Frigoribacterium sp. CG_9.8 TaxID=2787733 RepID=UPI0018C992B1|nr:helix-turn-helix transcriptional regulator [Frigoribacterium sp. CG_9.8]MBG6107968.1 DNA-binding PadR family transcriptional regulator [Frigoribacterium sp. CG_9.8]